MKKHSVEISHDTPRATESSRIPDPPNSRKICGCTGVRWCRGCTDPQLRREHKMDPPLPLPALLRKPPQPGTPGVFAFDPTIGRAPGCPRFDGLCVIPDFLSVEGASTLLDEIEKTKFALAQSGKQKQHFGAKVNFNKKKLNPKAFRGLPRYARSIEADLRSASLERMRSQSRGDELARFEHALDRFVTTDLFVLRYREQDASNLDFHLDDTFAYGEVIIDVSLESDSVLSFIREVDPDEPGAGLECVRASLPARSAAVLFGAARYEWEHAILHFDVADQRTSITLRTLSEDLRDSDEGRQVLATAQIELP